MTTDEAVRVCTILLYAHQGCGECARELIEDFQQAFPEHAALAQRLYEKDHPPA